jgi:hypothetical protein
LRERHRLLAVLTSITMLTVLITVVATSTRTVRAWWAGGLGVP